jgi:copper chaperone CopZ
MQTITYAVEGMTCAHCASAVSGEVGQLAGVADVRVDVGSGTVTVVSENVPDNDAVRAAVEEAGYALAGTA